MEVCLSIRRTDCVRQGLTRPTTDCRYTGGQFRRPISTHRLPSDGHLLISACSDFRCAAIFGIERRRTGGRQKETSVAWVGVGLIVCARFIALINRFVDCRCPQPRRTPARSGESISGPRRANCRTAEIKSARSPACRFALCVVLFFVHIRRQRQ